MLYLTIVIVNIPSTNNPAADDASPCAFLATTLYCPASLSFPSVIRIEQRLSSWKILICEKFSQVISSSSLYQVTCGVGCPRTRTSNLAALPSSMMRFFNGAVNAGASRSLLDSSSEGKIIY